MSHFGHLKHKLDQLEHGKFLLIPFKRNTAQQLAALQILEKKVSAGKFSKEELNILTAAIRKQRSKLVKQHTKPKKLAHA